MYLLRSREAHAVSPQHFITVRHHSSPVFWRRHTLTTLALLAVLGCAGAIPARAALNSAEAPNPITIVIDGKSVETPIAPVIVNNSVLVPLRGVLENMGARLTYTAAEKRIDITQGTHTIVLRVGQQEATVDAAPVALTAAPRNIDGTVFVPLRALAEMFGYQVAWSPANRQVSINGGGTPGGTGSTGSTTVNQGGSTRPLGEHRAALAAAGPFGISVDFVGASESEANRLLDAVKASGAGVIALRIDWDTVQPTKKSDFQWKFYDGIVRGARQRDLTVVGILGVCAKWASSYNTFAQPDPRDALYGPPAEKEYKSWETYVYKTVARYGDNIHAWQVWESPTSDKFRSVSRIYGNLLSLALSAARRADPQVIVHAAEPGGVNLGFIDEVLRKTPGISGVTLYPASQLQPGIPAAPENFLLPVSTLHERALVPSGGQDFWVGGLSAPTLDAPPDATGAIPGINTGDAEIRDRLLRNFTARGQADYLLRTATLALANNSGKVFWSGLRDPSAYSYFQPMNPEFGSGLIRRDFTPRPAYHAFQTLAKQLGDKPFIGPLSSGPGAMVLVFDNGKEGVAVAWALQGTVPLVMSKTGENTQLESGLFMATIPESQVLDAGGNVLGQADGTLTLTDRPVFITRISQETARQARAQAGNKGVQVKAQPIGYETANGVKATFGAPQGEAGIYWRRFSTFRGMATKVLTLEGRGCLTAEVSRDIYHPENARPCIFMDVADDYMYFARGVPVTVTVEMRRPDVEGAGFNLQYDSPTGYRFSKWQTVESGTGWATYTITLPDASFANRSGFDLMVNIAGSKSDLSFASITVRRDGSPAAGAMSAAAVSAAALPATSKAWH